MTAESHYSLVEITQSLHGYICVYLQIYHYVYYDDKMDFEQLILV